MYTMLQCMLEFKMQASVISTYYMATTTECLHCCTLSYLVSLNQSFNIDY